MAIDVRTKVARRAASMPLPDDVADGEDRRVVVGSGRHDVEVAGHAVGGGRERAPDVDAGAGPQLGRREHVAHRLEVADLALALNRLGDQLRDAPFADERLRVELFYPAP